MQTVKTKGGTSNYCSKGQHFTTGPVWKVYVGPTTAKLTVCAECAEGES